MTIGEMRIPSEVLDWLTRKVEERPWSSAREPRTVIHEWRHVTGGRTMAAALTARITPSPRFALLVNAADVEGEYVAAAKDGVLTALLSQSFCPVLACEIELTNLHARPVEASYAAFYMAAKEATEKLLGVVPGFEHNIDWDTDR